MTTNDLQGHSPTASLFKCSFLYIYAAANNILAIILHIPSLIDELIGDPYAETKSCKRHYFPYLESRDGPYP